MAKSGDTLDDQIAARLREARTRVFSSAAEAARALGMKPVTVRAHENGQNGVSYRDLERYARRYGVSPGWLLTGEGPDAPEIGEYEGYGELLEIHATVQDGVWLPDPPTKWDYARVKPENKSGTDAVVVYSDPRFPAELIIALKLISQKANPEYDGDCVLFAVSAVEIGFREGDHVIVYLERGEFTQTTLRKVVRGPAGYEFHAITSDEPPLMQHDDKSYEDAHVAGVVVGSQIRRRVNLPTVESLRIAHESHAAAVARSEA